ncbi:hypothetical protein N7495_002874 [Penicillium taxi]|uniref:uncharacterized protein n=1 Tax=Penicillium taxi TaxID=168475 RepID=UPI0025455DDB|nr:uncharacterized protein N7495_002874 [Penicillium taxi]KAJ5902346.1 hypothetical protein N7495_002874 [Penicillium taxi]
MSASLVFDVEMGSFQMVLRAQEMVTIRFEKHDIAQDTDSATLRRSPRNHDQRCHESPDSDPLPGSVSETTVLTMMTAAQDSELAYKPAKDEQLVNDALLKLLTAFTVHIDTMKCEWTIARSPFPSVEFGDNYMTARTDGFLQAMDTEEVFAIVGVKPKIRDSERWPQLMWQETGEMVAWIVDNAKKSRRCPPKHHLLVAQDLHEIYLVIATFDDQYIGYLTEQDQPDAPLLPVPDARFAFLKMQEYGPWNTQAPSNMKKLAEIFIALSFQVTEDIEAAQTQTG